MPNKTSNAIKIHYTSNKSLENKQELYESLSMFTDVSTFEENKWYLNNKKKTSSETPASYALYFASIPSVYVTTVKYFILLLLLKGRSIKTLQGHLFSLTTFLKFLGKEYDGILLKQIDTSIIMHYEEFVYKSKFTKATKESLWSTINVFFLTMSTWDGLPKIKGVNRHYNPFSRTSADRLLSQKYIPLNMLEQVDKVFWEKDIPHHIKTIYWICRLIPSRINEVTTLPIECLKPYGKNEYVLTLNMFKQNGGYLEPELRMIHLKYDDMGKYLIDLIRTQQQISKNLKHLLDDNQKGYLFTYCGHVKSDKLIQRENVLDEYKPVLLHDKAVRNQFNKIMLENNIRDEQNNHFYFTSHQLRHNAITDRIYEGFTLLEIRDMTAHKSNAMIEGSYIHPDKEKLAKIASNVDAEQEPAGGVYFKGKIIDTENTLLVKRLLAKPRSHKIGRLGICSDITGCKNEMFECFNCKYFVPNAEELPHFEEQALEWKKKVTLFEKNPMMKENALYNLSLIQKIVEKITSSLGGVNNDKKD